MTTGITRFLRLMAPLLLALLFSRCASLPAENGLSDLELTWTHAWVMVPDGKGVERLRMDDRRVAAWTEDSLYDPQKGKPYPIVIYLHGCTGIGSADARFLDHVVEAGFVVVAPDSMARHFRPLQCDPRTKTGGHNLFVYDFRQAEIDYALQRLKATPWGGESQLFLFGASEGGVAAALYRGDDFSGRIITHWTCHGGPLIEGISAPLKEPVLSIVESEDPWYDSSRTKGQAGDCSAFFMDRSDAQSVVLSDGKEHNVFLSDKARDAIVDFLKRHADQNFALEGEKGL